jgi:hypothetical protein
MYNKVGYHNEEYYRFGVVFIYNNGTLSNVYNISGFDLKAPDVRQGVEEKVTYKSGSMYEDVSVGVKRRKYIQIDDRGWVSNTDLYVDGESNINAKGVCRFTMYNIHDYNTILGIKFVIPNEVIKYLKERLGIRGCFFVRQKRIPNVIA